MAVPRFVSPSKRLGRENKRFYLGYMDGAVDLANLNLTGTEFRVLLALIPQAQSNDSFTYSNKAVANALGIDHSRVSTAVRRLRELGVLLHVGPARNRVIINPRYFWVGDRTHRVLWQLELKKMHPQHMLWYAPTPEERDAIKEAIVQNSGHSPEGEA